MNNNEQIQTEADAEQDDLPQVPIKNALSALTEQLGLVDTSEVARMIAQTIMPNGASDAELAAFCMVASAYHLNPLIKEIHAFRSKSGGIMPMIGIDGWLKLVQRNPDYDGMEHVYGKDEDGEVWVECRIYSKARPNRPTVAREFLSENEIKSSPVWQQRPRRMLKHRATIQAIRYFAGVCGFIDQDEAMDELHNTEMRNVTPAAAPVSGKSALTATKAGGMRLAAPKKEDVPVADAEPVKRPAPAPVAKVAKVAKADDAPAATALPEELAALEKLDSIVRGSGKTWNVLYRVCDAISFPHPEVGAPRDTMALFASTVLSDPEARKALEESGFVLK